MPDYIDKPSSGDFIEAIIKNIPKQATKNDVRLWGAAYVAAKVVKQRGLKKSN